MATRRWLSLTAALALGTGIGCTSVSSTYLHRDEFDTSWEKKKAKGVPVTLDVPTHVRIEINEKKYLKKVNDNYSLVTDGDAAQGAQPVRTLSIAYNVLTEKKMFMVDFKRPAAGPFTLAASFTNQQISAYNHTLTDLTIETIGTQINALLGTILPRIPGLQAGTQVEETEPKPDAPIVLELESLVAAGVFKLDDPMFEAQVSEFLRCYSANCQVSDMTFGGTVPYHAGPPPDAAHLHSCDIPTLTLDPDALGNLASHPRTPAPN
jgi:hypothetical protein